jgi:hypothetical protein
MRGYKFSTELKALRKRFSAEHNLETKYIRARYNNIRPINIILENLFEGLKTDGRREMRLKILSLWTGEHVRSSYDLTVYQCSTILSFLEYDSYTYAIGKRAQRFLEDSKKQVESGNLLPEVKAKFAVLEEAPF